MNPMLNLFPINVYCKHPLLNSIKTKYALCVLHQNRQHMWIVGSLWFGLYLFQVAIFCLGVYKIATSFSGHQYVTSIQQHVSTLKSVMVYLLAMGSRWVSVVEFHDPKLGIGKVFGQESTVVKWNYQILSLRLVTVCQKVPILDFQSEISMSKSLESF